MNKPDVTRLLDLASDMACVVGKDGRFQWINATFAKTLGWHKSEIITKTFVELIHPQDRDRFIAKLADLFRQKPVAELETRIQTARGDYCWVAWRVQSIAGGGLQAVLSDISAQKSETAVQEKQYMHALYQITAQATTIEDALHIAATSLDLQTGIISQIDDQDYTIKWVTTDGTLQQGQHFVLGDTYCDITIGTDVVVAINHAHHSPYRKHPCYIQFELEAYVGKALFINGERYGTLNFSSRHPRQPFTVAEKSFVEMLARWVEARLEQATTTETLAAATALQAAILENAGYAIIATDANGLIQLFNPAAQQLLGYSAAEMVGQATPEVFHDPDEVAQRAFRFGKELDIALEPGFEVFVARARRNLPNIYEWIYITKRGERVPVLLNVTALRNERQAVIGFLGIASDITEQKEAAFIQGEQMKLATFSANVGLALTSSEGLTNLLQAVVNAFVERLEMAWARVWLFDAESQLLELWAEEGLENGRLPTYAHRLRLGQGTAGYVAQETQPYATNRFAQSQLGQAAWVKREGLVAYAGYPLRVDDQLLGVLEIFARHPFSDLLLQTLDGLSRSVALSVRRAQTEQALRQTHESLEAEIKKRTAELSEANILLQAQVDERDQSDIILRKRAAELEIVTRVSEAASAIARTDQLMQEVVNLIKVSFDLYHAHFYVLNDVGDALVLSIGAGEVGRKLLETGYTIPLSEPNSLVVRAALSRQGVIENDLRAAPGYLANPLLPHQRSSMAIPMIVGDEVLGVLNVQSDKVNHFTAEDARIQRTLASQIALALQHTRSLARAQQAIEELNGLTRRLSRDGWADYFLTKETADLGFAYDLHRLRPIQNGSAIPEQVRPGQIVEKNLSVQGNTIGQITLTDPQLFPDDVSDIIGEVAEQLEAHIENLRLSEQMQLSLARTEALYASSDRIVRSRTLDDILAALAESVGLERFVGANFLFFDRPWTEHHSPDYMRVAAVWAHPAAGVTINSPGHVYRFDDLTTLRQLDRHEPTIYYDITADSRVGADLRSLLLDQFHTQGIAYFPLVANQDWFGIFAGLSLDALTLAESEMRRLRSLTDQAASVIQNLRLVEQTQAALAQTEALYQISTYLNAASGLNDIAKAVAAPSVATGATWAGIWLLPEADPQQFPFLRLGGIWVAHGSSPLALGTEVQIAEFINPDIFSGAVTSTPIFTSDIVQAVPALPPQALASYQQLGARALITLPLRYGDQILGMATIAWPVAHAFEEADMSFYRLLMSQVGVAVHGQLLLQESQQRSQQLARLAQIEAFLSQANNEAEILQAIVNEIALDDLQSVVLGYIDGGGQDDDLYLQVVSMWHMGAFLADELAEIPMQRLHDYSISDLWLKRPDEMLAIADVARDARASDRMREDAARDGWRAIALLPLRGGGRWQGVLLFTWENPHILTADERFIFTQLLEPLAATVASRRAFVAQRAARREMEGLYEASRRLNEASDLQELLVTIVESLAIPDLSRANLWLHERDEAQEIVATSLVSAWSNDPHVPPMPIGTRFDCGDGGFGDYLPAVPLYFIEDMANDTVLPAPIRELSLQRQVASIIMLPLFVQGERLGLIGMSTQMPHVYSSQERRICTSLAPQIALVLENKQLLAEARARAVQERVLREVTEKVRRSTHVETVMQTAVSEVGRILGRRATIYLADSSED